MPITLPILGLQVTEIVTGFTVTIRFGVLSDYELQIENNLTLRKAGGTELPIGYEAYASMTAELESLIGATVVTADADESAGLTIEFDTGSNIHVPISHKYEAWGIVGRDGSRVISYAGGEFAIWQARQPRRWWARNR